MFTIHVTLRIRKIVHKFNIVYTYNEYVLMAKTNINDCLLVTISTVSGKVHRVTRVVNYIPRLNSGFIRSTIDKYSIY